MNTKFKKGDRVRYIGNIDYYLEKEIIAKGKATYEVVDAYNCGTPMVLIKYEDTLPLDEEDLELVSRTSEDPKTAFLTELKELMERYQVEIECGGEDVISNKWLKFIFSDEEITYDNEIRRNHKCFPFPITPSNIFDYDK